MKAARLGDVALIQRKSIDPRKIDPDTIYLGLEHLERGGRIIGHDTVGRAKLASLKFSFSDQHVLYGKLRPNLGKIARPTFSGVCSTDILPVLPGSQLDRDYLAHYLAQPAMVDFAASRAAGANLPRLSPAELSEFEVPLPPLEEQRQIAAILDQADALRAKRRSVLERFEELRQSVYRQFFEGHSGARAPLATLAAKVVVGHVGPTSKYFRDTGVPFIRTGNVGRGQILRDNLAHVTSEFHQSLRKSQLRSGDVLISRHIIDEVRGAILPDDLDGANCSNIIIVRPSDDLLATTIIGYLGLPEVQGALLGRRVGSAQRVVNTSVLKELSVPIYGRALQGELAESVREIALAEDLARRALDGQESLFESLQSRAFRGQL